ncbi:aminotransferase class IV [Frondihabitans sp. 4ASC-45]|uniref:aminotransferase class IV n=1 Tax=Frondihabitans sp. 4ASC-45 TaxID=3111636 RepID=UPI003C1592D3
MKPGAARTLVVDSFLVDGGRILAAAAHRSRFVTSVAEHDADLAEEAGSFWDASVAAVPSDGRWFPRISWALPEGSSTPTFEVSPRPAPTGSESLVLATASGDPRTTPLVKGPDLARLDALRSAASRVGADEAVILSPDGLVVEGNYSSIVWWRGDSLCIVDESLPRLPSITESALVTLATALGVEIVPELVEPSDLEGHEVWSLASLHGPRIATKWVGGPALAAQPGRLRAWRARLDALRRPVA